MKQWVGETRCIVVCDADEQRYSSISLLSDPLLFNTNT